MAGGSGSVALVTVLERSSQVPLHRQLYVALRKDILTGRLVGGTRLPSTRELAGHLDVSRNTVMNAFRQLLAEGYIEGRAGSGTYVTGSLPEDLLQARARAGRVAPPKRTGRRLSRRGAVLATTPTTVIRDRDRPRAFRPGLPALDEFGQGSLSKATRSAGLRRTGGIPTFTGGDLHVPGGCAGG
jgi:GntR family transcriptional regulator/MocR family aminotransferase